MDELTDTGGSSAGTMHGYKVEARLHFNRPEIICGRLMDDRWVTLNFDSAPPGFGVPRGADFESRELAGAGCYGYSSAQALRWWFHAEADKEFHGMCLETRLVKYEIKHERKWKPVSHHVQVGDEDRSNCIPDWGKK